MAATRLHRGNGYRSGVSGFFSQLGEPIDWDTEFRRWKTLASLRFSRAPLQMKIFVVISCFMYAYLFYIYYTYNGGVVPYFLKSGVPEVKSDGSILVHYPQLQNDASRIQFACSANNEDELSRALKGDMHLVEGDIMLRGQGTNQQVMLPVMARYPDTDGPLTFQNWLDIAKTSRKALKLDFQSIDAVDLSLQVLAGYGDSFRFPLWLSGEILAGPNAITPPLDASLFIRLCTTSFPKSTLVLGWSTGPHLPELPNVYSWVMVNEMYHTVKKWKITQPVVFSMKSVFARRSVHQIKWLMEMTDASLVLANDHKDGMTGNDVLFIKQRLPKSRVFLDLSDELQAEVNALKMSQPSLEHNIRLNSSFQQEQWILLNQEGEYLAGTEAMLFQESVLMSKEYYQPSVRLATVVEALVQFVPPTLDYSKRQVDPETPELTLEVFTRVRKSTRPSQLSGIRFVIGSEGTMSISLHKMQGTARQTQLHWVEMPICVKFIITDQGSDKVSLEVFKVDDCHADNPKLLDRKYLTLETGNVDQNEGHIAMKGTGKSGYIAMTSYQVLHVSTVDSN